MQDLSEGEHFPMQAVMRQIEDPWPYSAEIRFYAGSVARQVHIVFKIAVFAAGLIMRNVYVFTLGACRRTRSGFERLV